MRSLHGQKGGKKSTKQHVPSESEGFALAVATAMHWANLSLLSHQTCRQQVKQLFQTKHDAKGEKRWLSHRSHTIVETLTGKLICEVQDAVSLAS